MLPVTVKLPIMLALCLMLSLTYHASIIDSDILRRYTYVQFTEKDSASIVKCIATAVS